MQTTCSPKSPDITPPDFTLWEFMKQTVFFQPFPKNVQDLSKMITNAAANTTPDALHYMWQNWVSMGHKTAGYHNEISWLIKLNMSGHIIMLCTLLYIVSIHWYNATDFKICKAILCSTFITHALSLHKSLLYEATLQHTNHINKAYLLWTFQQMRKCRPCSIIQGYVTTKAVILATGKYI